MRDLRTFDTTDLVAGLLLMALGAFVVWEAGHYGMGRMTNIGPGVFPRALGAILFLAGVGTAIGAFGRPGKMVALKPRAALAVTLSLGAFALLVEPFGLVPATLALTLIVRFAEPRPPLLRVLLLALALSAVSAAIFVYGLNLPIAIVTMP